MKQAQVDAKPRDTKNLPRGVDGLGCFSVTTVELEL